MSGRGFNMIPSWRSTSFDFFFSPIYTFDVVAAVIVVVVVGFFEYHRHGNFELCVCVKGRK